MNEYENLIELFKLAAENNKRVTQHQFVQFIKNVIGEIPEDEYWEDIYTRVTIDNHLIIIPGEGHWLICSHQRSRSPLGIPIQNIDSVFEGFEYKSLLVFEYLYATFVFILNDSDDLKAIYLYDHKDRNLIIEDIKSKIFNK